MDVLFPSGSTVENSKNGMQLLNNLMIHKLTVNDVMGSISTSRQAVQVRINGRKATFGGRVGDAQCTPRVNYPVRQ